MRLWTVVSGFDSLGGSQNFIFKGRKSSLRIDNTYGLFRMILLAFLANYDATKHAIRNIVDMPDRLIDLFIRFCFQNNGRDD